MAMKALVGCVLSTLLIASIAEARDTTALFSIKEALAHPRADEVLLDVDLYFGQQKHPKVKKRHGEYPTNKKTNAFGKSDEAACQWAFLSAIKALQQRAMREGGNAVINIKSNYKHKEESHVTQYRCGAGNVVAGVALKGTVVTLAK